MLYNACYYIALLIYFKIRGRNTKAAFLIKGLKEGFLTSKEVIWSKINLHQ
jgi:hypothetical protein